MKKILFLLLIIFLYACGENDEKSIIISFETNGGNLIEPITLDDYLENGIPIPIKEGYIFVSWYVDEALTEPLDLMGTFEKSITLYAKWGSAPIQTYSIHFITNGGSSIEPITVGRNNAPSSVTPPVKEGYTFEGWFLNSDLTIPVNLSSAITSNQTWYAKWETVVINTYTITFEVNGGSSINDVVVNEGAYVNEPSVPEKEGFLFMGWFVDSNLSVEAQFTQPIIENMTLYAKWEKQAFVLSFQTTGGTSIQSIDILYGDPINLPINPVKEGFIFDGWYVDHNYAVSFEDTSMPAHDITLYAKWVVQGVTITFDSMGGTDVNPLTGISGDALIEPDQPTREGYVFAGWFLNVSDEEIYDLTMFPYESITLYADWGTEGLFFQLTEDELSYEVGAGDAIEESTIIIPKFHLGLPVTAIMTQGFMYAEYMNVIELPVTLKDISDRSFMYASSLTEIHFPKHVENIGQSAFRFCHSLSSFTVSTDNLFYTTIEGVLFSKDLEMLVRYPQQKEGTSYTVPQSVLTIGEDAFSDADYLVSLDLGSGVQTIKSHAFFHMSTLESIIIPNQVQTMELYAFRDCVSLVSVTIGTGLSAIDSYVFNGCSSLETIIIPFNITMIGYGAFFDCFSLTKLYITRTSLNGIIQGANFMLANTPSSLVIYLPDQQTLNDYKIANFWSSYSSKMQIGQPE